MLGWLIEKGSVRFGNQACGVLGSFFGCAVVWTLRPGAAPTTEEDATDIVQFLDSLLLYLYEYPKRISDYREHRKSTRP